MKWSVYNAQTKQVEFGANFEADDLKYALTRTGRNSWHVHDCQWGKNFVVEL